MINSVLPDQLSSLDLQCFQKRIYIFVKWCIVSFLSHYIYVATFRQGLSEVIIVSHLGSCGVRSRVLSMLVQQPSGHSGV